MTDDDDRIAVARLLGRPPEGAFEVVVRDAAGQPVVIRNAPLLEDGRPMPTRFWLVGPNEVRAVSRLEAAGGVRRAEAEIVHLVITGAHEHLPARDAENGGRKSTLPFQGGFDHGKRGAPGEPSESGWFGGRGKHDAE